MSQGIQVYIRVTKSFSIAKASKLKRRRFLEGEVLEVLKKGIGNYWYTGFEYPIRMSNFCIEELSKPAYLNYLSKIIKNNR